MPKTTLGKVVIYWIPLRKYAESDKRVAHATLTDRVSHTPLQQLRTSYNNIQTTRYFYDKWAFTGTEHVQPPISTVIQCDCESNTTSRRSLQGDFIDGCLWCVCCLQCPYNHIHHCNPCNACYLCDVHTSHGWKNIKSCQCSPKTKAKYKTQKRPRYTYTESEESLTEDEKDETKKGDEEPPMKRLRRA